MIELKTKEEYELAAKIYKEVSRELLSTNRQMAGGYYELANRMHDLAKDCPVENNAHALARAKEKILEITNTNSLLHSGLIVIRNQLDDMINKGVL